MNESTVFLGRDSSEAICMEVICVLILHCSLESYV